MNVTVYFKNGESKSFIECSDIKYHEGFVEIIERYYHTESYPSDSIKSITKESRRSF